MYELLSRIQSPADLKSLSRDQLKQVADELRQALGPEGKLDDRLLGERLRGGNLGAGHQLTDPLGLNDTQARRR